jgi:hypothetical protein
MNTVTVRDYEFGERPTCNACGCELDPEYDAHHDGYKGSPYAHDGRGSYGMSSKHFVFGELCTNCAESRTAPLRKILQYNSQKELLECGHTQATPHNWFGRIRSGERRRCEKCRVCHAKDFDPSDLFKEQRCAAIRAKLRAKWLCPVAVTRHDSSANWRKLAAMLAFEAGVDTEFYQVVDPHWLYGDDKVMGLRQWVSRHLAEERINSDDH